MQVTVSARHGHLADATQADLREKAEKLHHFFDRLTAITVTVDLHTEKDGKLKVEIIALAEHKHEFVGHGENADVSAAFHAAADKVKQQMKHHKERLQDHRRDPSHNGAGD